MYEELIKLGYASDEALELISKMDFAEDYQYIKIIKLSYRLYGEEESIMFEAYYKITPNKNQSLTVETYSLYSDRTAHYNNLKQRYDRYFFFELDDVDTYEIKGNAEAWTLFYDRFTKSIDSILTTKFDLDGIIEEYSNAEENAKKGNYEYYVEEDASILFDIIADHEIAECDIDECVNMWNEMEG